MVVAATTDHFPEQLRGEPAGGGVSDEKDQSGLGAELSGAGGDGLGEASGRGRGRVGQRAGQEDERVEAAHFREDGDGQGPRGGEIEQGAAGAFGAGEPNGLRGGMF